MSSILFLMLPLLFIPVETLFYSCLKTTPGNWVFGIKLSKRPSFKESFQISCFKREKITEHKAKASIKYISLFCIAITLLVNFLPKSYIVELISVAKQEVQLDSWVEVKDPSLNFSVYFPEKPDVEKMNVKVKEQNTTLNVTEYSHIDKVSYSLVSSKIPSSWTFLGSNYLFNSLGKAIEIHQGKITHKKIGKHGSNPCMEYLIKNHTGGETKGVLILVKRTIYKLEVKSAKKLSEKEIKLASDFISTFNIT